MSPRNKADDAEAGQGRRRDRPGFLPFEGIPLEPDLGHQADEGAALGERLPSVRHAPATSRAAASRAEFGAEAQREQVFACLLRRGRQGATAEELGQLLELPGDSIRPRLWELRGLNRKRPELPVRVQDSKTTRRTRAGRAAVVWQAIS